MQTTVAEIVEIEPDSVTLRIDEFEPAVSIGGLADSRAILRGAKKGDRYKIEYHRVNDPELGPHVIIDNVLEKVT